ncbi:MAG TPA: S8 family serine peptidase [Candidatus Cybelea sp.]|nr:S8 family serine peptidase [Candidatus Cybelea sp.]
MHPNVAGWGPADFQARYDLPSTTKGSGQIVAVVDAYDNPNAASDLAAYRTQFGLGTANLTKFNQDGKTSNFPRGSSAWGIESDLDVEMVSATCPLCTIYLVEANSADTSDLDTAEAEAVKLGAHIVSSSWACLGITTCGSKRAFSHKGVAYLAAASDTGSQEAAPADFDTVAAIGGTTLSKSGSSYSETAWSTPGGCAMAIKKPVWQHDTDCSYRLANDAAAVATNIAEYDSYGYGGWFTIDGTSAAAPLIAGVFGLAGNAAAQDGGRTFWLKKHHKSLYDISGCSGYGYGQYSTCTGWGTPKGIGAF